MTEGFEDETNRTSGTVNCSDGTVWLKTRAVQRGHWQLRLRTPTWKIRKRTRSVRLEETEENSAWRRKAFIWAGTVWGLVTSKYSVGTGNGPRLKTNEMVDSTIETKDVAEPPLEDHDQWLWRPSDINYWAMGWSTDKMTSGTANVFWMVNQDLGRWSR